MPPHDDPNPQVESCHRGDGRSIEYFREPNNQSVEPTRVLNGIKLRQLLRVVIVSVLAAGQMFLVAHACARNVDELARRSAVATPNTIGVALETARRALDGERFLTRGAGGDCADLALRAVLASETGIVPYVSRLSPRAPIDLPKPVFAGRVRISWLGMADRGEIDSAWLGSPQVIDSPPHTILHCRWRI